jgi:hypothetical protein
MQVIHWGHDHLPRSVPSGPRLHKSNAPHFSFCSVHANFPPTRKIDNTQAATLVEISCLRWEHSRTDVAQRLDAALVGGRVPSTPRFGPRQIPTLLKPWRNAPNCFTYKAGEPTLSHPITGIAGCCALAASGRAAEQRDELAPSHSITSSARPSSGSGTVRPSALGVLRLIISSTLVACCTGRSAGFSPLRMRPVYTPERRYESVTLPP